MIDLNEYVRRVRQTAEPTSRATKLAHVAEKLAQAGSYEILTPDAVKAIEAALDIVVEDMAEELAYLSEIFLGHIDDEEEVEG